MCFFNCGGHIPNGTEILIDSDLGCCTIGKHGITIGDNIPVKLPDRSISSPFLSSRSSDDFEDMVTKRDH